MAIILKFKRMGYSSKTMKCKRKRDKLMPSYSDFIRIITQLTHLLTIL